MTGAGTRVLAIVLLIRDDPGLALRIDGRTLLSWTVARLRGAAMVDAVILALADPAPGRARAALDADPPDGTAPTMATGPDAVGALRAALLEGGPSASVVLLGADRPLGPSGTIDAVVAAVRDGEVAVAGQAVRSTLKRVAGGGIVRTEPREAWRVAGGPWAFRRDALERALAGLAERPDRDDRSLPARLAVGLQARLVDADADDLPIRTAADTRLAERWIRDRAR